MGNTTVYFCVNTFDLCETCKGNKTAFLLERVQVKHSFWTKYNLKHRIRLYILCVCNTKLLNYAKLYYVILFVTSPPPLKIMISIYVEALECTYCSYFPINYSPGFSGHTDWSPTLNNFNLENTKQWLWKTTHQNICCTRKTWKRWYCLALRSEGLFRVCMCTSHQCIQTCDWGSEEDGARLFSVVPSERTGSNEH